MQSARQRKNTWLKKQRDRALFDSYRTALSGRTFVNQREAVDYVRTAPAPRFYISAQAASVYVNMITVGRPLPRLNPSSKRRIKEIYRRYSELRSSEKYAGFSTFGICQIIVEQPAPEYYIGYELASKIICRELNRHNDNIARRLAL